MQRVRIYRISRLSTKCRRGGKDDLGSRRPRAGRRGCVDALPLGWFVVSLKMCVAIRRAAGTAHNIGFADTQLQSLLEASTEIAFRTDLRGRDNTLSSTPRHAWETSVLQCRPECVNRSVKGHHTDSGRTGVWLVRGKRGLHVIRTSRQTRPAP